MAMSGSGDWQGPSRITTIFGRLHEAMEAAPAVAEGHDCPPPWGASGGIAPARHGKWRHQKRDLPLSIH
jgi:hypothetical protein